MRDFSGVKLFDIAANLSDERYKGEYYGGKLHEPDFDLVIQRANQYGVRKFLFGVGYFQDQVDSYELSLKSDDFYCMFGVHPCRAREPFIDYEKFREEEKEAQDLSSDEVVTRYIKKMDDYYAQCSKKEKYIAIGECGLDYDRFEYADKETQLR